MERKRMQFVSDRLVDQVIQGRKTASVTRLDKDEYNHALVVGENYDVYDSSLTKRCTIRITAMELARWDNSPERLWRGENNSNADEFRQDHGE